MVFMEIELSKRQWMELCASKSLDQSAPSVQNLRDSRHAWMRIACSFGALADERQQLFRELACDRSFGLRVSGAVAPSALPAASGGSLSRSHVDTRSMVFNHSR
jgi:hypothetical protein